MYRLIALDQGYIWAIKHCIFIQFLTKLLFHLQTILSKSQVYSGAKKDSKKGVSHEWSQIRFCGESFALQCELLSRGMLRNLNIMIQQELKKYSLKNIFLESTAELQKAVLNALHILRLHMIERRKYVTKQNLTIFFKPINHIGKLSSNGD